MKAWFNRKGASAEASDTAAADARVQALMAQTSWASDAKGLWSSEQVLGAPMAQLAAGNEETQHKQTPAKALKPKKGKKVPAEKGTAEVGQSEEKATPDEQRGSTATLSTAATSTPSTFVTDPGACEETGSSDEDCCNFKGVTTGTFMGSQGTFNAGSFISSQPMYRKKSSSKNGEDSSGSSDEECLQFPGMTPATFMGSDSALDPSTDFLDDVKPGQSFFFPAWG